MKFRPFLLLLAALTSACMPATASGLLNYVLDPTSNPVLPGDTILLTGSLSNTGNADLFLNDFLIQFTSPADLYFSADPNYFFDNVPGLFEPGDPTYAGPIFSIIAGDDIPPGTYSGTATIYGGDDESAHLNLGVQTFTLVVAPEPSGAVLCCIALALVGVGRRRL